MAKSIVVILAIHAIFTNHDTRLIEEDRASWSTELAHTVSTVIIEVERVVVEVFMRLRL